MLFPLPDTTAQVNLKVSVSRTLPGHWPSAAAPGDAALSVFQSREFLATWQATRGMALKAECYFVTVRDRLGNIVLLLPLAIHAQWGARTLAFMDGGLADTNAPVLFRADIDWTPSAVSSLWRRIEKHLPAVDAVCLEKMPQRVAGRLNPLVMLDTVKSEEGTHGLNLRAIDPADRVQGRARSLRRNLRQIARHGAVSLVVHTSGPEVDAILERTLCQKQRRMEETLVRGLDREPDKIDYFRAATRAFAEIDRLQVCALKVGDAIVATSWNLVLEGTVSAVMIGHEAGEWARYSPGRLLNTLQAEWLAAQGYSFFDLGHGDECWKYDYCDTHIALVDHARARNLRGLLARRYRQGRLWLRANPSWQRLRRTVLEKAGHRRSGGASVRPARSRRRSGVTSFPPPAR